MEDLPPPPPELDEEPFPPPEQITQSIPVPSPPPPINSPTLGTNDLHIFSTFFSFMELFFCVKFAFITFFFK